MTTDDLQKRAQEYSDEVAGKGNNGLARTDYLAGALAERGEMIEWLKTHSNYTEEGIIDALKKQFPVDAK